MGASFELIFFSYSHSNKNEAESLEKDIINAGIPVWRDNQHLPGTLNFDVDTRKALEKSSAVIYLGSPEAQSSNFVQGELSLAKSLQIPIIPVWIHGEKWEDCAPIDFIRTQYIDCREFQYSDGKEKLIKYLRDMIDSLFPSHRFINADDTSIPGNYIIVMLEDRKIAIRVSSYLSIRALLDELYSAYLQTIFPLYSYGEKWCLQVLEFHFRLNPVILPWQWLIPGNYKKPLVHFLPNWADTTCKIEHGLLYFKGIETNPLQVVVVKPIEDEQFFGLVFKQREFYNWHFIKSVRYIAGRLFHNPNQIIDPATYNPDVSTSTLILRNYTAAK